LLQPLHLQLVGGTRATVALILRLLLLLLLLWFKLLCGCMTPFMHAMSIRQVNCRVWVNQQQ
jgi:hypothetical protein